MSTLSDRTTPQLHSSIRIAKRFSRACAFAAVIGGPLAVAGVIAGLWLGWRVVVASLIAGVVAVFGGWFLSLAAEEAGKEFKTELDKRREWLR